jgi:glycosyltransferase involved in cell wall biosynthesis
MKKKIAHIITSLNTGGAEYYLLRLIKNLPPEQFEHIVISLTGKGSLTTLFLKNNICVINLNFKNSLFEFFYSFIKLFLLIKRLKPSIIFGWMYHGIFFSFLLKVLFLNKLKLIWLVRQTLYDIKKEKKNTQLVIYLLKLFSASSDHIIYNSYTSKRQHEKFGFYRKRSSVIHNNVDLREFRIKKNSKQKIINIFCVARFHPMKNHDLFIKSFFLVLNRIKNIKIHLIGNNISYKNDFFKNKIYNKIFRKDFVLHDNNIQLQQLYNNCDLLVSTSAWGEGFPNVIAECSAKGIESIATNIGDTKFLILNKRLALRPNINPIILSEKIIQVIKKLKNTNIGVYNSQVRIFRNKLDINKSIIKFTRILNEV